MLVHTFAGQVSNAPSSSKSTTINGSVIPNPNRSSVISALVFRKVKLVELRKARLEVMLRFVRLTVVEAFNVMVGRMRMLPLGASNRVLVMLFPVLVESMKSQVLLVRIVVFVKLLLLELVKMAMPR